MRLQSFLWVIFMVLFALGADMHHISVDWSASGDTVSSNQIREISTKICTLAKRNHRVADSTGNKITFDDYFRFLEKADSIKGDVQVSGMIAGGGCIKQIQIRALRNHKSKLRQGQHKSAIAPLDSAKIAHKNRTNPDWREDEAERKRKMHEEVIPAFVNWLLTTYYRWVIVFFFYVLVFWHKDENVQRFGWFAAAVYALGWPVTLWLYAKRHFTRFARWVWFEAKLRQAQENIWAPLSQELKEAAWEFAQSSKSLSAQRADFHQAGLNKKHALSCALVATLVIIPLAVDQPHAEPTSNTTIVVVQAENEGYTDNGGKGPITAPVVNVGIVAFTVLKLLSMVTVSFNHQSRYRFFVAEPPPSDILKVPIVWQRDATLHIFSDRLIQSHEKARSCGNHLPFPDAAGVFPNGKCQLSVCESVW